LQGVHRSQPLERAALFYGELAGELAVERATDPDRATRVSELWLRRLSRPRVGRGGRGGI